MPVLKSLCRFRMCADVKDSLVVISFPGIDSRLKQAFVFFFFFRPAEVVNFRLKSLLETTFAQSQQIYPFDDCDTHTRSIDLVGVESAHSVLVRLGFEPATMLFLAAVMDKSRDSHK